MTDEEVGDGSYRVIAIELKHLFESMWIDADAENDEIFLSVDLENSLTTFLRMPSQFTLCALISVSPTLLEPVREITRLVAPSLLTELPTVV